MRAPGEAARARIAPSGLAVAVAAALLWLAGCGGRGDPGGGGPAGAGVGGEGASPTASPSAGRRAPEPPAPGAGRALHAAPGTWVLDLSGRVLARPRRMDFASDASLLDLRWRGWGGPSASASGRVRLLRCDPDCADGTVFYRPARIRLTGLKRCGRARFYAVATVTYRKAGRSRPIADYIRAPC